VIPNQGAAAHEGAAKRCQGCRQILNYCLLLMFNYINYCKIVIINQLGVPPIFFKYLRCAENQKRLNNTALHVSTLRQGPLQVILFFIFFKIMWSYYARCRKGKVRTFAEHLVKQNDCNKKYFERLRNTLFIPSNGLNNIDRELTEMVKTH
jgi:hypothetical protein